MPSSHAGKVILSGGGVRVVRFLDDSVITYYVEWLTGPFATMQFETRSMAVVGIMCNRGLVKLPVPLSEWIKQFKP